MGSNNNSSRKHQQQQHNVAAINNSTAAVDKISLLSNELKAMQRKLDHEQIEARKAQQTAEELRLTAEKAGLRIDQQQIDRRVELFKELFRTEIQLQEQLGAEGKRYRTMEESLRDTLERIRVLELDGQRNMMAEFRKTATDGSKVTGDSGEALQRAKTEKERWEILFQDLSHLLVVEQEKGRELASQLAAARAGSAGGNSPHVRKASIDGRHL